MELIKNVFFNTDKLIENTKIKISYTGKFFKENCDSVSIHYGFGTTWDNVNEVEMTKTELGFQVELALFSSDSLNLCFKNNLGEWDNNEGKDYSFPIEKAEVALVALDPSLFMDTPHKLRKTYLWNKKIKLAIYKLVTYIPRLISGNYKRKLSEN